MKKRKIRLALALLGAAWILVGFTILAGLSMEKQRLAARITRGVDCQTDAAGKYLIENPKTIRNMWIIYGIVSIPFLPLMATAPPEKIIEMLKEGARGYR